MQEHDQLWAKWTSIDYHPVMCHLIDVMCVCQCMWRDVLQESFKDRVSEDFGIDVEHAGSWIAFLVGSHDVGKISLGFQRKTPGCVERLKPFGFDFPSMHWDVTPHGTVAARVLRDYLPERGWHADAAKDVATVIGGHHGILPSIRNIRAASKSRIGGSKWAASRCFVLQQLETLTGVDQAPAPTVTKIQPAILMVLAGLTSVCDWIGSSRLHFPFTATIKTLHEYAAVAAVRACEALKDLGWTGWKPPETPCSMQTLFPFMKSTGLRPLQQIIVEIAQDWTNPTLVIIESPMGEGKTEAAMYLADRWSAVVGQQGCYFALPTQATSNQMFSRIREFLGHRLPESVVNLQLMHGHASISSEFQELRRIQPRDVDADQKATVLAAEWFTYRKRGLLAPFGVGTIDQALLAVLQTKHVFVRLYGLANKTVIIDEVHAYDAYMSTLLERLIAWLRELGCSVVLLSATLPKARRQSLLGAYEKKAANGKTCDYPRVSWIEANAIRQQHTPASEHRSVRLEMVDPGDLVSRLSSALPDSGCVAIICNTVTRAQEIYSGLANVIDPAELDLFHARFPFEDRTEREKRTLEVFGKNVPCNYERNRRILVATQVVEQSLDIDFDLMVSELAPIDLMLQRSGRLHRHARHRPAAFEKPMLWILKPVFREDGVPDFGPNSFVYDDHILLLSYLAIRNISVIRSPADFECLIESVYSEHAEMPTDLAPAMEAAWLKTRDSLTKQLENEKQEARDRLIKPPDFDGPASKITRDALEEDSPELHKALQAVTRLSEPTVTVACLYWDGSILRDSVSGGNKIDMEMCPSRETSIRVLKRSLKISHPGVVKELMQNPRVPRAWYDNALLSRIHVLRFDQEGEMIVGEYRLCLSNTLGLLVKRTKQVGTV